MFLARIAFTVPVAMVLALHVLAADFAVNSNIDAADIMPGDGVCQTVSGSCTFRAAVQEANLLGGTDTISFAFSAPTVISLSIGDVLINDDLIVSGNKLPSDIRLVGSGSARVLTILRSGISVTVRGLTISNGFSGGNNNGGGIFVQSANLTLENVVVRDNIAGASGSGVYSGTGVFRFINSFAINNLAQGNGGGGGLSFGGNGSMVQRSAISGNQAPRGGGGIEVTGGTATILETSVENNSTNGGGGGILAIFSTATINRSTIAGNTAYRSGGGIALPYGNVSLINSTVSGNRVTNGGGGGINSGENGTVGNITIRSSTIVNNTALYSGGLTGGFAQSVRVGNSILSANVALSGPNILSEFTSLGGNLVSDRSGSTGYLSNDLPDGTVPMLGPLANNGGPTRTHALLSGSPAINAGSNGVTTDLATDQRGKGFSRVVDGTIDIGAFELAGKAGSR